MAKFCPTCQVQFSDDMMFCTEHGTKLETVLSARTDGFAPGDIIDQKYILEKKLGEGGMGSVWRAQHSFMKKAVALKLLRKTLARSNEAALRFAREAKVASQIDNPHCITLFDCGQDPQSGSLYLAMEYLEGESLRSYIKRKKRLSAEEAVDILCQLLSALGAAHRLGIIHRDIKPENIFLLPQEEEYPKVKLLDFGIAKQPPQSDETSAPITQAGFTVGTPEYISPEQAGAKDLDGRADLYSAGVILYELLAGRRPFLGDNPVALFTAHLTKKPEPFSSLTPSVSIPRELELVVMRSLEKRPDNRYPDATAFEEALEQSVEVHTRSTVLSGQLTPVLPDVTINNVSAFVPSPTPDSSEDIKTREDFEKSQDIPAPPKPRTQVAPTKEHNSMLLPVKQKPSRLLIGLAALSGLLFITVLVLLFSAPKTESVASASAEELSAAKERSLAALEELLEKYPQDKALHAALFESYQSKKLWAKASREHAVLQAFGQPPTLNVEVLRTALADYASEDVWRAQTARGFLQNFGAAAIAPLDKVILEDDLLRAPAISFLGVLAKDSPRSVGVLANALGRAKDCETRAKLATALASSPQGDQTAIQQLEGEQRRLEKDKTCTETSKAVEEALEALR